MPATSYVFLHPWLSPDEKWGALYVTGDSNDTLLQLARLCREAEAGSVARNLPWFVPAPDESAVAPAVSAWPANQAIFLLSEPEQDSEKSWLTVAKKLRAAGSEVGVVSFPHKPLPPANEKWSHVVIDASHARTVPPVKMMVLAVQSTIVLAGVRARQDFEWGVANQIALASPEHLLARAGESSKPDMLRTHLLQLLSLVTQDADSREIEEIFRLEPKLSYSLLRLVNSAALSLRQPINSFGQAIALLGRRQLQRWLQLLVYADPGNHERANPLLQWAAMRGRLMEICFQHVRPMPELAIEPESAFMTGIFSLLDVLLNLPMDEILAQLPVASPVKLALTERAGPLGDLLKAIESAERRRFSAASEILAQLGISASEHAEAQLAAIEWANKVTQQASR